MTAILTGEPKAYLYGAPFTLTVGTATMHEAFRKTTTAVDKLRTDYYQREHAIRTDRTINRKERRKRLALLRKGK
jgi:hypothetical protein